MDSLRISERNGFYEMCGPFGSDVLAGFTKTEMTGKKTLLDMNLVLSSRGIVCKVAYMKQVHGPKVMVVNHPGRYLCDGIFTSRRPLVLVVRTADCMPVVFYSKKLGVAGVVHMGWRSAEAGILENIPYDLRSFSVIIGAGLRRCCYQVGKEFKEFKRISHYVTSANDGCFFDPVKFCRDSLERMGLEKTAIYDTARCTFCDGDKLHSHRRDRTPNRMLTFILDKRWCGGIIKT